MSIAGELTITLLHDNDGVQDCQIASTRPMQVARVFQGKSIDEVLMTLPMIFSICGKAQSATAVRAIESVKKNPASIQVESQREALILLESLREHSLHILMDWPVYIGENPETKVLSAIVQNINRLMQSLEPKLQLSYGGSDISISSHHRGLWKVFSDQLSHALFAIPFGSWSNMTNHSLDSWCEMQKSQSARFIYNLHNQEWKRAGISDIKPLPPISDQQLVERLRMEEEAYTAQPDWQSSCYELSWFSHHSEDEISRLTQQMGNGIYTRMVSRLLEISSLTQKLETFFIEGSTLESASQHVDGLAHTNAARGRLTHYVELEKDKVSRLLILAPTEWNFHPQGAAKTGLCNLQATDQQILTQQANLLIQAIDPCVAYQLEIKRVLN